MHEHFECHSWAFLRVMTVFAMLSLTACRVEPTKSANSPSGSPETELITGLIDRLHESRSADSTVEAASKIAESDPDRAAEAIAGFAAQRRNVAFHSPTGLLLIVTWTDSKTSLMKTLIDGVGKAPVGSTQGVEHKEREIDSSFISTSSFDEVVPLDELVMFSTASELMFVMRECDAERHLYVATPLNEHFADVWSTARISDQELRQRILDNYEPYGYPEPATQ